MRMTPTFKATQPLTLLMLVMGVGVLGLFANLITHLLNPSIIMIQPSQVEAIVLLELVGMAISFALRKRNFHA